MFFFGFSRSLFTFQPSSYQVGGFTPKKLLDKTWSQVSPLLPPGTCLHFLSRIGFSIPTARRFSSNVVSSRFRAFRQSFFFMQEKVPTSMHSVRLEPTKLILMSTRTTYQATGDAGLVFMVKGTHETVTYCNNHIAVSGSGKRIN